MKLIISIFLLHFSISIYCQRQKEEYEFKELGNKKTDRITLLHFKKYWELRNYLKENIYFKLDSLGKRKIDSTISTFSTQYYSVGPFYFIEENKNLFRIIRNKMINKEEKQLFYVLDTSKSIIGPDILSEGDSYFIESKYLGIYNIKQRKKNHKCYKIRENIERYHKNTSRVIYIDAIKLIPCRIEYYDELNLKKLIRIIQLDY